MAFDGITIAALVKELNTKLGDSYISRIVQPEKDELLITTRAGKDNHRLYLSASASLPLVYLTDSNKQAPITAPAFCMLLRKHLQNGRIVSISQPGLERVIMFDIEHRDEMGDLAIKRLIIEIMGKYSNIILTDTENVILDSIKRVPSSVSSVREVLPGREYFIPQTQNKKDPLSISTDEFTSRISAFPGQVAKAIYATFTGISPVFAEEVCFEANVDGGAPVQSLEASKINDLSNVFEKHMKAVREGSFTPVIVFRGTDPVEFGAVPFKMYADAKSKEYDSISQVLMDYYSSKNKITRMRQKSADLRHLTTTALARERRKLDLQEKQLSDTGKMDKYRIYGELLNANGYSLSIQGNSVSVNDYNTGKEVLIPVDPNLNAYENAQKYFNRYNKLKRTKESLTLLIKETRDDVEELDSILTSLDMAENETDLSQIRSELAAGGWVKSVAAHGKKKIRKEKSEPLCFRSKEGFLMYVGKNNTQNDELTFGLATGNDWWFHAKKLPGSHVIVKSEGKELPDSVFEEAGRLAAHYSKAGNSDKVEIDYIQKKHIKKPNSAKPGFVIYHTNYSLVASTDISDIKRVQSI